MVDADATDGVMVSSPILANSGQCSISDLLLSVLHTPWIVPLRIR